MRLFEKAKRLGVWNPADLDFAQDVRDWAALAPDERDILQRLLAMFAAGEEAVTIDLLPLIQAIAGEGRLEEEMFLTTFLFEEAKHVDFFGRILEALEIHPENLARYHTENYRRVFYDALPAALQALRETPTPAAQVRASMTYNVVVEGMLAETGYHTFFSVIERRRILPAIKQGVGLLKQDESRHIAYGIYLLSRLIGRDDNLWPIIEQTMDDLFFPALGIISEAFDLYDPIPFDLDLEEMLDFATGQFNKRMARIEAARGASAGQIAALAASVIETDDG